MSKRKARSRSSGGSSSSSSSSTERSPKRRAKLNRGIVVLNVGGTKFTTSTATLSAASGYFERLFASRWADDDDDDDDDNDGDAADGPEEVFLDRDPEPFRLLLSYMRTGDLCLPIDKDPAVSRRALLDAEYLDMEQLVNEVKAAVWRKVAPSFDSTDEEAVKAFGEKYAGLGGAVRAGVLPGYLAARGEPKVLQIVPCKDSDDAACAKLQVHFPSEGARAATTRDVLALALVRHPGQPGETLEPFVQNPSASEVGGGVLASRAFPSFDESGAPKDTKFELVHHEKDGKLVPCPPCLHAETWNDGGYKKTEIPFMKVDRHGELKGFYAVDEDSGELYDIMANNHAMLGLESTIKTRKYEPTIAPCPPSVHASYWKDKTDHDKGTDENHVPFMKIEDGAMKLLDVTEAGKLVDVTRYDNFKEFVVG